MADSFAVSKEFDSGVYKISFRDDDGVIRSISMDPHQARGLLAALLASEKTPDAQDQPILQEPPIRVTSIGARIYGGLLGLEFELEDVPGCYLKIGLPRIALHFLKQKIEILEAQDSSSVQ